MRVKLEDVCERGSSNIKQSDIIKMSGNYPIYGASGLAGKVNFYHQEQPYVAVVKDGAGIGRTTLNPAKSSVIGTMQYLIPKKNVLPEYLFYVVSYMHLEKYYTGATIPHIYFKDYKNEEFNLDNIEKQLEIIDVLGRCKKVIEARKQELVELDSLTKARFVELFGNIKEEQLLGEISEFVTVGIANSATHAYVESGVPMLRNQNIKENYLDDSDLIYIKPEFAAKYESKKLKENDIIAMRTGYPGVACLVPKKYEGCQTFTTLIVRLKENNNPSYVCSYINSDLGKRYIDSEKVGVAQQNIGAKSLAQMPIKIAPKELQDEYATFVKQVDKSKFDIMTFAPIYAIINLYLHAHFYQGRR